MLIRTRDKMYNYNQKKDYCYDLKNSKKFDISKAIKRGKNVLTVEVVNTWANALKGMDNGTPPFAGIWTNGKYRRADNSLLPAGLLGPVKLLLTK